MNDDSAWPDHLLNGTNQWFHMLPPHHHHCHPLPNCHHPPSNQTKSTFMIILLTATILFTTAFQKSPKPTPTHPPTPHPSAGPVWFHQIGHASGGSFTWVIHPEFTMGDLPWVAGVTLNALHHLLHMNNLIVNIIMLRCQQLDSLVVSLRIVSMSQRRIILLLC